MKILAIETSCDETAVAIVENGRRVLSNQVFSQILKHKEWGGVIPELASRMHLETINPLVDKALADAHLQINEIDAFAVTQGPGLLGSLMIGVNVAKTLSWIHSKPLIAVNHLHGHVCANFIDSELEPPFLCMLASGGHTQIIAMHSAADMEIMGETIDDAAGEAFDKVARLMDLPYPGGPHLDKLAQSAEDVFCSEPIEDPSVKHERYSFPVAQVKGEFDFSFSGLKTAVLRIKDKVSDDLWQKDKAKIAKAFQDCVAKTFSKKIDKALEKTVMKKLVLAGGVAANSSIRQLFKEKYSTDYELVIPSLKYCTDNAAMIGAAAFFVKDRASLELGFDAFARV